jgi:hypothetical protein
MQMSESRFLKKIELFLCRFANVFFVLSVLCFVIFSGLLFETKLFLMGDDADYIMDGFNFIHNNAYPSARASLYGMMMGLVMLFSGPNIFILKLFSFACAVAAFYLLFKTFKEKIPYWLLFAVLFFTAFNSAILYYSSSNLSEAFFMMIQGVYFHAVFLLIQKQEGDQSFRKLLPYWCYVGIAGLFMTLSKNVAIVAPLCLAIYYLLKKEYRNALLGIAFFALFKIPYEIVLRLIYGKNTVVSQIGQIMVKDIYNPDNGQEDVMGFIRRFYDNAGVYLSNYFINILGLHFSGITLPAIVGWVTIVAICSYALWVAFKQNKFILFVGIYLGMMMGISFLALQADIAQTRIIIIYVPLLIGLLLFGATHLFQLLLKNTGLAIVAGIFCLCLTVNVISSLSAIKKNFPVLTENMKGNTYYGYTPDWINYLSMGQYIKHTLPDSVMIAARKPNSLTVYSGGRPYCWLSPLADTATADGVLKKLAGAKIRYLVLASLRKYPEKANNEIIITLHGYKTVIEKKYPDKIKFIKQIGDKEPCSLVEILY